MSEPTGGLEEQAQALAARAGLAGPFELERLPGGRNNQAFALRGLGSEAFLKVYFRHPGDTRDRLGAEFAFLRHAWGLGLENIAEPLARDDAHALGLFSLLHGARLSIEEVSPGLVEAAARFYQRLNPAQGARPDLPDGSEACFSLAAHLSCVDRRVARLTEATGRDMREDAAVFVTRELAPTWESLRERARREALALGLDLEAVLAEDLRRVSPSDFGFHNALRGEDGQLYFLDFEYAGMDDPAKMVCDFFCQPDLPAPRAELPRFLERVTEASPGDETLAARVDLLLPVYLVKWCCIMLNDFLPVSAARRDHAERGAECGAEGGDIEARCDRQLARTGQTLNTLR